MTLPPRTVVIERLIFSPEKDFYDAIRSRPQVRFDAFVAEGRVLNNYASVLAMLLQMRQACDHPFLVLARPGASTDLSKIGQTLLRRWRDTHRSQSPAESEGGDGPAAAPPSEAFIASQVAQLQQAREGGADDESGQCVICLEMLEDPVITSCAHQFCRECIVGCLALSARPRAPCAGCQCAARS